MLSSLLGVCVKRTILKFLAGKYLPYDIILSVRLSVCDAILCGYRYILQQVSEEVNRKCPP